MHFLDYIIPPLACLIPYFSCAFIPLILFASGIAWFGREHRIYTLPSRNLVLHTFQVIIFTLLSAAIHSHLVAKMDVIDYCTRYDSTCESDSSMLGLPIIPDTLSEAEAIIRYLLPPTFSKLWKFPDTCYTGNQTICSYTSEYMMLDIDWSVWLLYVITWIFSITQAFLVMQIMRRKFPDERKAKRKPPE